MPLRQNDRLSQDVVSFNKKQQDFDKQLEEVEQKFGGDEPILGFEEINETLDDAEDRLTSNIVLGVWNQTQNWVKSISADLDKLDEKAISLKPLNLAPTIQGHLLNGWREIFKTGSRAGLAELNELNLDDSISKKTRKFSAAPSDRGAKRLFDAPRFFDSDTNSNASIRGYNTSHPTLEFNSGGDKLDGLARFDRRDLRGADKYLKGKAPFEVAYPPDQADLDVIEIDELREALNLRTQVLASDISQDVNDRISRVIKDSVDYHYVAGKQVQRLPRAGKRKIINRINGIINYERQKQIREGVDPDDAARLQLRVFGDGKGFVSRSKIIASTELNAGYNLGRLQTYHRTGVKKVRWQAVGDRRTCKICKSRNGVVVNLSTILRAGLRSTTSRDPKVKYKQFQYFIPTHPFCRCAWQAATEEEIEDPNRKAGALIDPKPLAKTWGTIGAAAGLMSRIGQAGNAIALADRLAKERQLQEQSNKRARNRTLLAAGGALSLGVLSIGLWSWLNAPKQTTTKQIATETVTTKTDKVRSVINALNNEEVKEKAIATALTKSQSQLAAAKVKRELELRSQPLSPVELMRGRNPVELGWNQVKQQKYKDFLASRINLKTTTDTELRIQFGLLPADINAVRGLQRQQERQQVKLSPYQKLLPAAVVPPNFIAKYPWLAEIEDIRTLSLEKLIKRGIPKTEADKIYTAIYRKSRSTAGLARRSKEERRVLKEINKVKSVEELQGILNLTRKERDTAERLFAKLKTLQAKGDVGFDNLAQIRVFGIGDKTVARLLAEADKGALKINLLPIATDRALAEQILQERISGVGPKMAAAIYDALLDTGTQFLDAEEMYQRILPYIRMRGVAIADNNKLRKNLERLDFIYLSGMDNQPVLPSSGDGVVPPLLVGNRRGDTPRLPGGSDGGTATATTAAQKTTLQKTERNVTVETTASSRQIEQKPSNLLIEPVTQSVLVETSTAPSVSPAKLKATRIRNRNKTQANIDLATEEIVGLGENLERTYNAEIKRSKSRPFDRQTVGSKLAKSKEQVSKFVEKNIDSNRSRQRQQADSLVENIDRNIEDLKQNIQLGIEDPLASQTYTNNGTISSINKKRINSLIEQIDEQVSKINEAEDLSKSDRDRIKKLKKKLIELKKQAKSVGNRIKNSSNSTSSIEQQRVQQKARGLIDELKDLPTDSIKDGYPLNDRLEQIRASKRSSLSFSNTVIDEIDELLAELETAPGKILSNSDLSVALANKKLKQQLIEQKARLIVIRDRILTPEQKALNISTQRQRELIARQQKEFKTKLQQFEQDFIELEQAVQANDKEVLTSTISSQTPEILAANRQSYIAQAERNIKTYSDRLNIARQEVNLLKSDRWQDYATSLANLEDASSLSALGNNYMSFDELVVRRNRALRRAKTESVRAAGQVSAWANNPQNILLNQQQELAVLKQATDGLVQQQQMLKNRANELIELAQADPTKNYSELIKRINDRALLYKDKIANNQLLIKQSQANLDNILKQEYALNVGYDKPRTPEQINRLSSKIVRRTEAKLVRKDKAQVTQIFDKLEKASIDIDKFITAASSGKYTEVQQQLYDSLTVKQKRSLSVALDKDLLSLNRDSRILRNSRLHLYSLSRRLKQQKRSLYKDIVNSIPVRGARSSKTLSAIELALKSDNIEEVRRIASQRLSKKAFSLLESKLVRYGEIIGNKATVSSSEIGILAGVRPPNLDTDTFLIQVKGNLVFDKPEIYSLAELKQAIELNGSAIARIENRLLAVNFNNNNLKLDKF